MHPLPPGSLVGVVTLTLLQISPAAKTKVRELAGLSFGGLVKQAPGVTDRREDPYTTAPVEWRHAYSPVGTTPLCSASTWHELAPAGEVTCPKCRRLQREASGRAARRRTVLISL